MTRDESLIFLKGAFFAIAICGAFSDWLGLEQYIVITRAYWVDLPPAFWGALALVALISAIWKPQKH
jgi:hypothetical protein